ncbi:lipopolysaccharide biosynthesis protein [Ancylobacter terrae]|uniref:lipopolysaccharide biosynthesis protein n=1 Tax=Ancylobacter sp. sgz301288 TaxID=3342077 RepID=UPI00385C7DC0
MTALSAITRRLDLPLLAAAIATSGLKVVSAVLNYGLLILLARILTVEDFGLYGMIFSASVLVAAALIFGQPVLILKSIPEYSARSDPPRQKGVIFFGSAVLLATSLLFLLLLWLGHVAGLLPAFLRDNAVLGAFALLAIVYALSDYSCNLLRAFGFTCQGIVPRDIVWRLATIGVLVILARGGASVSVLQVLVALGTLLGLLVAWQFWRVWRIVQRDLPQRPAFDVPAWRTASSWMAIGSLLFATSATVDTIIVGWLLGTQDAAVYFSAARTAAVSSLLLVGLRLIAAPVFAHLHYGENPQGLRTKIELVYALSAATAALVGVAAFVFAPEIMRVFGAEYAAGILPFRMLVVGLSIATAGGMSSSILESTGGERLNARILLLTQAATALAVAVGAYVGGLYGAALAKAACVALEAVWLSVCVFARLTSRPAPTSGTAA